MAVGIFARSPITLFLDDFLRNGVGLFLWVVFFCHIVPEDPAVKAVNVKVFFNHAFTLYGTQMMNLI